MNVENPLAFGFIMQEDIYLLEADKSLYNHQSTVKEAVAAEPDPVHEAVVGPEAPGLQPRPAGFKFMGGNKKHYLILTYYPGIDFIDDGHLAALQSTLGRLNTSVDDVAIINMATYHDTGLASLHTFFNPQKVLFLGKKSLPAGSSNIAMNNISQVDGIRALLTFSFDEMMNSVDHKKAFWEQMKQF